MTHMDYSDVYIKTEPLSPESSQQVLMGIALPAPHNATPLPQSPPCPNRRGYSNIHTSPMMSRGVVKTGTGFGNEPQASTPAPTTPTTSATCTALKSSILNKRRARGELTPLTSTDDGPREYKLTEREMERKAARKEQNRRAARRCRMKKKRIQSIASQEMQNAIKENVEMKHEVDTLRQQVDQLQRIISEHEHTQQCTLEDSYRPRASGYKTNTQVKQTHKVKVKTESRSPPPPPPPPSEPLLQQPLPAGPCQTNHMNFHDFLRIVPSNYPDIAAPSQERPASTCGDVISSSPFPAPTPMDWNPDPCALHPDQEVPEDLEDIINKWLETQEEFPFSKNNNDTTTTNNNNNNNSSYYSTPEDGRDFRQGHTKGDNSNSKPAVVRNLNKYFLQHENENCEEEKPRQSPSAFTKKTNLPIPEGSSLPFPTDTASQANRFLLHPNLTSPTLSSSGDCVPPNLVQPLVPSTNNASPCVTSSNKHQENQTVPPSQCPPSDQFPPPPSPYPLDQEVDYLELPYADIEALSSSPFLPYASCPIPPPGTTLTNLHTTNTLTDLQHTTTTLDDRFSSSVHDRSPGGFIYQLSPISTPSTSTTPTPSPGFLHQSSPSPRDRCLPHGFNNTVPVFNFSI